jgi:hypothetical protein
MRHAAAMLLLLLASSPADAHKRMAPLKCQALPGACTDVVFENYATQVPLTNVHQAGTPSTLAFASVGSPVAACGILSRVRYCGPPTQAPCWPPPYNQHLPPSFAAMPPPPPLPTTGGMGNLGQFFQVVPLASWGDTDKDNSKVPQISMCRGPEPRSHIWGHQAGTNRPVYARAGSMLQYSYDGTMGGRPTTCGDPTYPGASHWRPADCG